jgi:hypothetical protein
VVARLEVMVAAAADSYGGTSAADTVNQLTSDGTTWS